jgi:hypothetical protein
MFPFRERRDGGPELVIRRKHPVVAVPVLAEDGALRPMAYPATNMLLVTEKL